MVTIPCHFAICMHACVYAVYEENHRKRIEYAK